MRFDPTKDAEFVKSEQWQIPAMRVFEEQDDLGSTVRSNSLSGNERNRLFLQRDGNYDDAALVSGLDFKQDGRGFVLFDFDQDGWVDIGLTSVNSPRFRLLKNSMGTNFKNTSFKNVVITLVGGNDDSKPSTEWSSRDAIGTLVYATTGDETRVFQLSCGEGLSSQNALSVTIGMGEQAQIDSLRVVWPSGLETVKENVAAGARLSIHERDE